MNENVLNIIKQVSVKFSASVTQAANLIEVKIGAESLLPFTEELLNSPNLKFNILLDVTATDWVDTKDSRFELVYHLLSLEVNCRVRIKVAVSETDAKITSLSSLYKSAIFLEREVFDMYGISFEGHPDLRRILMYPEFKGYPLRKDYPVQGKQPRIKLRSPEVANTATMMKRPELYTINTRKEASL